MAKVILKSEPGKVYYSPLGIKFDGHLIIALLTLPSLNGQMCEDSKGDLYFKKKGETHLIAFEDLPETFFENVSEKDVIAVWNTWKYDLSATQE